MSGGEYSVARSFSISSNDGGDIAFIIKLLLLLLLLLSPVLSLWSFDADEVVALAVGPAVRRLKRLNRLTCADDLGANFSYETLLDAPVVDNVDVVGVEMEEEEYCGANEDDVAILSYYRLY